MLECGVDLDASSSSKHWAYSSSIYHALIRSSCTAKDAALAWSYYDEMKVRALWFYIRLIVAVSAIREISFARRRNVRCSSAYDQNAF